MIENRAQYDFQLSDLAAKAGLTAEQVRGVPEENVLGMVKAKLEIALTRAAFKERLEGRANAPVLPLSGEPRDEGNWAKLCGALGVRIVKGMTPSLLLECAADQAFAQKHSATSKRELDIIEHARELFTLDRATSSPESCLKVARHFADVATPLKGDKQ